MGEKLEAGREIPDYESYDYEQEWRGREIEDRAERELLARWLEPGGRCLELGGGFGRLTSVLEEKFGEVSMVDFSRRNLSKAAGRLSHTSLIRAPIGRLPFGDDAFSAVIAVRVLHHVANLSETIAEMVRVAEDGGYVMVGVPNTRGRNDLKEVPLCVRGPQGHAIYVVPMSAYSHPMLEVVGIRGLGLFDNALGRRLRGIRSLSTLDVATSHTWEIKPETFIKFRVRKSGRGTDLGPWSDGEEGVCGAPT